MPSIFTRIIRGELPCYRILETDSVLAFLSIDPINPGHTLVVPKEEIDHFLDVPAPAYEAVFRAAQPIARAIRSVTGCRRVGMAVQGFEVPHFHLHLIPLNGAEEFDFRKAKKLPDAEMRSVQEKIIGKLQI